MNETVGNALATNEDLKLVVVDPNLNKNKDGDGSFATVIDRLNIASDRWKERIHVINGSFGGEQFVHRALGEIVRDYHRWDTWSVRSLG